LFLAKLVPGWSCEPFD